MLVLSSSVLEQFGGSVFVATTMNKILVVVKYFTTTSSINNPNNIYNVIVYILAHSYEIRADWHLTMPSRIDPTDPYYWALLSVALVCQVFLFQHHLTRSLSLYVKFS